MGEDHWVAVIIDDDPDVRDLIEVVLTHSGFRTVRAPDGPAGVEAVRQHRPLLTTLDVNMPGMDGFAVAKRLREFSDTYLIMITALGDEIDVVQGFEAGADDYLVKPFRPRELRARADSMLRRPRQRYAEPQGWAEEPQEAPAPAQPVEESWAARAAREFAQTAPPMRLEESPQAASPPPVQGTRPPAPGPAFPQVHPAAAPPATPAPRTHAASPVPEPMQVVPPTQPVPPTQIEQHPDPTGWLRLNGLALDPQQRVVTVDGKVVDLTATEFALLTSLMSTGRRVRSKADLVLTMRGQQYITSYFVNEADKRVVEAHMASIRRKLGDDGVVPRFIEVVRGVGYRMAEAV